MNERYYIVVNGQQAGPFTIEELKSKGIQPDTLVWTEGLENWTKAKYIPFLKDVLRATPPPIPNTEANATSTKVPPTTPPPVSNDKYFGYELALRRERLLATIIENIVVWVPITMLLGDSINDIDSYSADYIVIDVILSLILGAFFYKIWGGNLGHKIMGLVVISAKDGQIQNNAKIGAIREVLKSVFSLFFIPVVWLLWDDDRQNLYDKVVRTYVVRKNRQEKERQIKNFLRGCLIFFLTFFFLTFLLIWGSIYFYINGISVVANYVVEQIPISVDKEVGREARREILDSLPIDEEKTKILTEFYSALGYDNKTKVYVVKGREFNAFALPDNSIFVFDQVLREVKSYPELAALLGHEYAHIKNRHGMKNLAHAVSRELLTAILAGSDRSNTLISNSNKLLTLKNSRELENEADKGGLELLIQNRIDGNGMAQMLRRIEKLGQKSGKNIPAYLSTHPDIEDRIETIEEEIKRGKNDYIHREELERLFQQLIAVSK